MLKERIPVIIDTDPGVDDIVAMFCHIFTIVFLVTKGRSSLLAIASPELDILAYIVSYGNSDLESSLSNIVKTYSALHCHVELFPSEIERFPNLNTGRKPTLARGASAPLQGDIRMAQYFHGRDGLGDITQRHPELVANDTILDRYLNVSLKSGVDVALDILQAYPPRSVTYVALGPLTNLALMMRQDSQLVTERIGRVVSMGGAFDVPGNTSPVAEFNYFADPYAVKELLITTDLHRGIPRERFIMLPLDVTTPHELPFPLYQAAVDSAFLDTTEPSHAIDKLPLTHFTSSFFERTREVMLQFGKDAMELHDIVAIWCAINHPSLPDYAPITFADGWKAHARVFDIERTGELTRGMLVVDRRDDVSAYPLGSNRSEAHNGDVALNIFDRSDKVEIISGANAEIPGVIVIHRTPGPDALLRLLLERVWGSVPLQGRK